MQRMTSAAFLGLERLDEHRWRMPVVDRICGGGRGSLFGGAGLAAGVLALEQAADRPAIWCTGQYISLTSAGDVIDLEVTQPAVGRTITQGRVVGHLRDREIVTVMGAVGRRREVLAGSWHEMPDAGQPEDGELVQRVSDSETVHQHVEVRMARGMFGFEGAGGIPSGDHRNQVWLRMPEVELDAAVLAMLADYMPSALGNAFGQVVHCTSLDNTIRFAVGPSIASGDGWVLCDNQMDFVGNGIAHGSCTMWSRGGDLLAAASQSVAVVPPGTELR